VVDHLGVVLGADAGQELALGLWDAQAVEGALDVFRHVVPVFSAPSLGFEIVVDLIKVDAAQVSAPARHGLGQKDVERLVAELAHPLRLVLVIRNLVDHGMIQAAFSLENRLYVVVKAVFILFFDALKRLEVSMCCH
jgi:hypothetical protein